MRNREFVMIGALMLLNITLYSQNNKTRKSNSSTMKSETSTSVGFKIASELSKYYSDTTKSFNLPYINADFNVSDSTLTDKGNVNNSEYRQCIVKLMDQISNFSIRFTFLNDTTKNEKDYILTELTLLRHLQFDDVVIQDTAFVDYLENKQGVFINKIRFTPSSYKNPRIFWNNIPQFKSFSSWNRFVDQNAKNKILLYVDDCTYITDYRNFYSSRFLEDYKNIIKGEANKIIDCTKFKLISSPNLKGSFFKNRVLNCSVGFSFFALGSYALYKGSKSYLNSSGTDSNFWPGAVSFLCYGSSSILLYRAFIQEYEKDYVLCDPNTNCLIIIKLKF